MPQHFFRSRSLIFGALLGAASTASLAVPIAYTSLSSFAAASAALAIDSFDDLSITTATAAPLTRTLGAYQYVVHTTGGDGLFGAGADPDHWLSVNTAGTSLVFSEFSAGVQAVGGLFFGSDASGAYAPGAVLLTATDGSGSTTLSLSNAVTTSFVGFVSSGPMTSLTVAAVQPAASFLWTTANDLALGTLAPVPEPTTVALMLAGLGLVGGVVKRRTKPVPA